MGQYIVQRAAGRQRRPPKKRARGARSRGARPRRSRGGHAGRLLRGGGRLARVVGRARAVCAREEKKEPVGLRRAGASISFASYRPCLVMWYFWSGLVWDGS